MFNTQSIPGEAESTIDWTKLQEDFSAVATEPKVPMGTQLYPIFEVAVWELTALHQLLAALDARHVALEHNLMSAGDERQYAQRQLTAAENELCEARAEFLEALRRLYREQIFVSKSDLPLTTEHTRSLDAIGALWDLEAAWGSRLLRPSYK